MKSSGPGAAMRIGDVAQRFGLATHVLRHWESMGLLSPVRTGRDRRYGPGDLYRVAAILRGKEAGFSLEDIREMINTRNVVARRAVLHRRRTDLARRIAEAQASLELIDHALDCDHEDFTQCDQFRATLAERVGVDRPYAAARCDCRPG